MSYLVDSDRVVDYLKGLLESTALIQRLLDAGLAISVITYAEVYEGIYYGSNPERSERIFRAFLRGTRVLGISRAIARRFASLRGDLRRKGLLIPVPDLLIAATALEHELVLVTRNRQHFERIPGLTLH